MKATTIVATAALLLIFSGFNTSDEWLRKKKKDFTILYTPNDKESINEYGSILKKGIKSVQVFTGTPFKKQFEVYIHPDRASLDKQWQKDWGMPDFKSECWMVASGTATKLDLISPKQWTKEACEHSYDNKLETEQLLTHELFHVFHGQHNASPDFSNTEGLDWFVEGFATYASGQCDISRLEEVKKAVESNTAPATLDKFWTGKLRYGLSGSVVKFIDETYGRKKLLELLPHNRKTDVLTSLNITEEQFLTQWKAYMASL